MNAHLNSSLPISFSLSCGVGSTWFFLICPEGATWVHVAWQLLKYIWYPWVCVFGWEYPLWSILHDYWCCWTGGLRAFKLQGFICNIFILDMYKCISCKEINWNWVGLIHKHLTVMWSFGWTSTTYLIFTSTMGQKCMQKFHMDRDHASHTSIRDIPVRKLRQKNYNIIWRKFRAKIWCRFSHIEVHLMFCACDHLLDISRSSSTTSYQQSKSIP